MKNIMKIISVCTILIPLATTVAHAEAYIGIEGGYNFQNNISGIKGNENLNYPDAADNTDPTTSLLHGAKYTNLSLKNSGKIGVKAGYYFNDSPFGVEGEFDYSKPDFKRQNVTITHSGIAAVTGGADFFTEDQQPAKTNLYTFALNGIYRYKGFQTFTPYIGAGPALYVWDIHGTGLSGIIPSLGETGVYGKNVNEHPITWGTSAKVGLEYSIAPQWALGAEYHYNWSAFKVDNFRSVSDGTGDYTGQSALVTIVRHF